MRIVGIDPGLKGACALYENNAIIKAYPIPTITKEMKTKVKGKNKTKTLIDIPKLVQIMSELNPDIVCIEEVGAMPGQGVVSMFSFGFTAGILHGVSGTFAKIIIDVRPQVWKEIVLGKKSADKDDAIQFCKQNCPDISLKVTNRSKTDSDGIADAICIAIYGAFYLNNCINNQKGVEL